MTASNDLRFSPAQCVAIMRYAAPMGDNGDTFNAWRLAYQDAIEEMTRDERIAFSEFLSACEGVGTAFRSIVATLKAPRLTFTTLDQFGNPG